MKSFFLIIVIFLAGDVYSQDSLAIERHAGVLGIGEILQFKGKTLKFKKLISDSRCPTGATCIWEGEAKMLFELYDNGELLGEKVLITSGGAGLTSLVDLFPKADFIIAALKLMPYPEINRKIAPSEYRVNVQVQESMEE